MSYDEIFVQNLHIGWTLDIASGHDCVTTHINTNADRLIGERSQHDVFEVEDDVSDVLSNTSNGVKLVQGLFELHRRNGGSGDGGQQHAAKRVTYGVAETGFERADRKTLTVIFWFADCFDCGALDDEHLSLPFVGVVELLRVKLNDELFTYWYIYVLAGWFIANSDLLATISAFEPTH